MKEENEAKEPDLISHHTFMLPFKWSPKKVDGAQDGFVSVENFQREVGKLITNKNWECESFTLDHIVDYNEFHYFYDYVREALYDYGTSKDLNENKNNSSFIRHLSFVGARGGKYIIETPIPKEQRPKLRQYDTGRDDKEFRKRYELEIDSVLLHLYYTGVGVLSYHLHNRKTDEDKLLDQSAPEDILYINQYGRRIFPPYYNIPHEEVGFQDAFDNKDFTTTGKPHGGEIAYKITVELPDRDRHPDPYSEDWPDLPTDMLKDKKEFNFRLAEFTKPFLGELWEDYRIQSVLDDRMFTICWYGSQEMINTLRPARVQTMKEEGWYQKGTTRKPREEDYKDILETFDWWYKFVFVDAAEVTVQNPSMRRKLLANASYLRWSGYGTYYGITDYSFVLLTGSLGYLRRVDVSASYLVTHVQSIYFRLAELVLVQRACVQRFSDEVTHVSRADVPHINTSLHEAYDPKESEENRRERETKIEDFNAQVNKLSNKANELYKRYIRFVNRVYFREVTAQVQGIELYQKLHEQSRLPNMVDALSEEIHELHNYVRQETDRQSTLAKQSQLRIASERKDDLERQDKKRQELLTLLGALFVAPGILISVYDLGVLQDYFKPSGSTYYFLTIIAAGLSALISYQAFKQDAKEEKSENDKARKRRLAALIQYAALLALPVAYAYGYGSSVTDTVMPVTTTSTELPEAPINLIALPPLMKDTSSTQSMPQN